MTRDLPPATPTRRSKRFQPVVAVTPRFANLAGKSATYAWGGSAIFERDAVLDDLYDEETLEEEEEVRKSAFFEALTRTTAKGKGRKGKGKDRAVEETATFKIGDMILIDTPNIYPTVRKPSVAVIVAMWHVDWPNDEDLEEDAHLQSSMRIRVHWFLRPSELASVRARRDHLEVSNPSLHLGFVLIVHTERDISIARQHGDSNSTTHTLPLHGH